MNKVDVVFMFSNWYSGATLFSLILNEHPEMICNGETFPFGLNNEEDYICSCGNTLSQCEFYTNVAAGMMDREGKWDKNIFRRLPRLSNNNQINQFLNGFSALPMIRKYSIKWNPNWNNKINYFTKRHIQFIQKAIEFDSKSTYIDGTKNIRRAEILSQNAQVNPKVIHLVRDGRGFCNSWAKNNKIDLKYRLKEATSTWNDYISLVDEFSSGHQEIPILTIRYEDLCNNIESCKSSITDFIELKSDWVSNNTNSRAHILGNRMRNSYLGTIKEDLSWKHELQQDLITEMESQMLANLKRFKYI